MVAMLFVSFKFYAQSHKMDWKEMHDFHEIVSITFHSAEGDLFNPLKENTHVLIEKAQAWKNSAIPAGYEAKATKKALGNLVKECKKVDKMVKSNKPDAALMAGITKVHDVFHGIMEMGGKH